MKRFNQRTTAVSLFVVRAGAAVAAAFLAIAGSLAGSSRGGPEIPEAALASAVSPGVVIPSVAPGTASSYAMTIDSVSGGPESQPPVFYTNNVSVSGTVSTTNYLGQLDQYHVEVDWGDGSVYQNVTSNLTATGSGFTGTWVSSPSHAYASSGNYTITARLYHGQPPGCDGTADAFQKVYIIVVIPPAIVGTVFNDLNDNGIWDNSEPGIGDVGVSLSGPNSASANTSASGFYHFDALAPGTYTVSEVNPAGYRNTTPSPVLVTACVDNVYTVNFGLTSGNTSALIYGTVYDDVNGNGVRDPDESDIPGVTVTLNGSANVTTDQYGQYRFEVTSPGNYTVVETDPPGYYSTTTNIVNVAVTLESSYEVDFGDKALSPGESVIFGYVFNDLNGNGLRDTGEPGIASTNVTLGGTANVSTTTGNGGYYFFDNLAPGNYTVNETNPSGYISTTPDSVYLTIASGQTWEVDFGDALSANSTNNAFIEGTVYNDANADGQQDLGELGMPGVTVSTDNLSCTTNRYGQYTFKLTSPRNYSVNETDPVGYYSTTPNPAIVAVTLGNSYQIDFGNTLLSPCSLTIGPKTASNQLPDVTSETLNVTVKDQRGAGIPGQTVGLSTTFGTLSSSNVTTGSEGTANVTVSSSVAGTSVVVATLGPLSDNATAIWLAAALPPPPPPPPPNNGGSGNGGGGGAPPTTTPPLTSVNVTAGTGTTPTTTPPEPLYFTVDFLGRITRGPMSSDGRLLEPLNAPGTDGSQMLRFPQNNRTLDSQGKVVTLVQIREAGQVPELPPNSALIGKAYEFTPSGATFDGQVSLTLSYDVNGLPAQVTSVWIGTYEPSTGWEGLNSEQNRVASVGQVTAPVPHFSIFAVLAGTTEASFRSSDLQVVPAHRTIWRFFPLIRLNGREASISADAMNQGGQQGIYGLSATIDGKLISQRNITLNAFQTQRVTFDVNGIGFGHHTVEVGGLSGQLVTSFSINWWLLTVIILVLAGAGWLIYTYIYMRMRRTKNTPAA